MKKKLILLLTILFMIYPITTNALSISSSSKSITNGNSVTITVNASGLIGKFSITSSNSGVLSGGTSSVWLENETKTYTFTAKSVGTATITVTPIDVSDTSGNSYSGSKSVTISVVKPREKSTNNYLKSLSVDGYTLSPEFNKNTLEYTVNVESSVEEINISASKEDSYSSISGTGKKQVNEGDNKFQVVVTSEVGSSKTYTINAVVQDSNPIIKEIDKEEYTVIKRSSSLSKPDGFIDTEVTINDTIIPAFYNELLNLTLIGLKDSNGNIFLYCYDSSNDKFTKYTSLTSISKTIIFLDTEEVIDGFNKEDVTIEDIVYSMYKLDNNDNYYLVYGMDLDTGNKGWYLYNLNEKTIQTYMSDIIDSINNNNDKKIEEYKVVVLVISGISLLLLLILIFEIISKNKIKKKLIKKFEELKKEDNIQKKPTKTKRQKQDKMIEENLDKKS